MQTLVDAGAISELSFSPDGRLMALLGSEGTVQLWDMTTGMLLRTLFSPVAAGPTEAGLVGASLRPVPTSVFFSPDGTTLAVQDIFFTTLWRMR
jgi:WD40 repeat protein